MKKYIIGMLAAASCCVFLSGMIRAQLLVQNIAGKVLRFHILANSDSSEDQELKLQVRDAVGGLSFGTDGRGIFTGRE